MIYVLRETSERGYGLFAAQDIGQDERILCVDLIGLETYMLTELEGAVEENPGRDGDRLGTIWINDAPTDSPEEIGR